jgi:hypothetical protein
MVMRTPGRQFATCALLALLVFSVAGCRKRHVQAAPMPAPSAIRPAPDAVPPPEVGQQPINESLPELVVPPALPAPRPPRRAATQPTAGPEPEVVEPKPAPPRIAPRLTPADENTYKEKTWQAIMTTEKNLDNVEGRTLSPAQQDIEGKIRGFLAQAREAIGVGDWVRALNLAEKALVLSRELANSF